MSLNSADGYGGKASGGGSMGGTGVHPPRLLGAAAYATWAPEFLTWLQVNGLHGVLEREIPKLQELIAAVQKWEREEQDASFLAALSDSVPSASSSSVKAEDAQAEQTAMAARQAARAMTTKAVMRAVRVRGLIVNALPEDLRAQVSTPPGDAFALWRWLENKFQSKEADSVGMLWTQWCALQMEAGEPFDAYRARVNKIRSLLLAAKEEISPSFFAHVLLDRLQQHYKPVVLALQAGGKLKDAAQIDFEAVTTMINAHERKEMQMSGSTEEEKAMAAYRRQKGNVQPRSFSSASPPSPSFTPPSSRAKAKPWHKDLICRCCKQKGHIERFCPQNKTVHQEGRQRGSNTETAAAAVRNTDCDTNEYGSQEEGTGDYAMSALTTKKNPADSKTFAELAIGLQRGVAMGLSQVSARRPVTVGSATSTLPLPSQVEEEATSQSHLSRPQKQSLDASLASTAWGVDTMASCHVSGNRALFSDLKKVASVPIMVADGSTVQASLRGTIQLRVWSKEKAQEVIIAIHDVLFHERFAANLLSWIRLADLGWSMRSSKSGSHVTTPGGNQVVLSTRGKVMVLERKDAEHAFVLIGAKECSTADDLVLLHERLGHMGFDRMIAAMKAGLTLDMGELTATKEALADARRRCMDCAACVMAKGTKQALGKDGLDQGSNVIEALHMDSFTVVDTDRVEYGLAINDPYSAGKWFAHALTKDLLPQKAIDAIINLQTQTGKKVKRIHCDGGSEFINATLKEFCRKNGTELHYSPARTPQLNGIAERSVRLFKEGGSTLLLHAKLPKRYWPYAVKHYLYVWNRIKVGKTGMTPFEAFRGEKPSVKYLGVFGADVWSHMPKIKRQTFDAKMEPGIYLGHDVTQNCPIVLLLQSGKIVRTKDVRFPKQASFKHAAALRDGSRQAIDSAVAATPPLVDDELELIEEKTASGGTMPQPSHKETPSSTGASSNSTTSGGVRETSEENVKGQYEIERIIGKKGSSGRIKYLVQWKGYPDLKDCEWKSIQSLRQAKEAIREYEDGTADTEDDDDPSLSPVVHMVMCAVGREQRSGVEERTYDPEIVAAVAAAIKRMETLAPETFQDAMQGPAAEEWRKAMDKEMKSCEDAGTWKRVRRSDLPANANVIPCKWVYKLKNDETGAVTEHKARLTPKGFRQKKGVDYFEVFARTGMYKTMRVGLSLTAAWNHELDQMDVPSAFLNAPIEEELYMEMPEGYREDGFVFKLEKALYGLKQAPRNWYLMVSQFIKVELGFTECVSDPCLFFLTTKSGRIMLLFLFVDDFQVSYHRDDKDEWCELKKQLIDRFRTKDMGQSKWILGMRIERDRVAGTITLDQELYVTKALEKFGLSQCKSMSTPALSAQEKESDEDGAGVPADKALYMEIVGTLLYATISTRPDINYAVQRLSRHLQAPLQRHMIAAERVLRYLSGTKKLGLIFGRVHQQKGNQQEQLVVNAFADADWANDKIDRKSITGWVAKLNGDVVSWASKKQRTVAQSTCEAELYAEAAAMNEVLWLRGLLSEMNLETESPSLILGDNQSTIALSQHGVKSERTKHVDVKYHFITDEISKGAVEVKWVPSAEQQADIFTKALATPVFELLRGQLMTR